jgi:hypothetical protein
MGIAQEIAQVEKRRVGHTIRVALSIRCAVAVCCFKIELFSIFD